MKGYELSPEATDDLQEIWVYIANDNPTAADQLEDDIYAACELLKVSRSLKMKWTT
jgi:plasmid stabilization system protein ParE